MDTEFPGVVARPITDQYAHDYQYQTVRCNVDLLKIIQLGVGFVNEKGATDPDLDPDFDPDFDLDLDLPPFFQPTP